MKALFCLLYTLILMVAPPPCQAAQLTVPADHPYLCYIGRVDKSIKGEVRFDWPGIIIEGRFTGTSCTISLGGSYEYYGVFIDTVFTHIIKTDSSLQPFTLAKDLPDTVHTFSLVKRFETNRNLTRCTGITIDPGHTLLPPLPRKPFFIEFIGASTIMGYGNESKKVVCDSLVRLSNIHYSFGPIAARLCNAEYAICAKTRSGLVRNYRSRYLSSKRPFTYYYNRTLLSDSLSKQWRYTDRTPDAIVISLGMNDYSTTPHPPKSLFIEHYRAFTQELYCMYPASHIVCATSWREPLKTIVEEFVTGEQSGGNHQISFFSYKRMPDWQRGCDWHPNVKAHQHIAALLAAHLQPILKSKNGARPCIP